MSPGAKQRLTKSYSSFLNSDRNAKLYNPEGHFVHEAAKRMSSKFDGIAEQFKSNQLQKAQKSFARASSKPNSSVAALVDERNRRKFLESLVPSSGTLIVVPGVLMEHWQVRECRHSAFLFTLARVLTIFSHGFRFNCNNMLIPGSARTKSQSCLNIQGKRNAGFGWKKSSCNAKSRIHTTPLHCSISQALRDFLPLSSSPCLV